jgi:hypothetical protein
MRRDLKARMSPSPRTSALADRKAALPHSSTRCERYKRGVGAERKMTGPSCRLDLALRRVGYRFGAVARIDALS